MAEDLHELFHLLRRNGTELSCVSSYIPAPDTLLQEKNLRHYFAEVTNTMGRRVDQWLKQLGGGEHGQTCVVSDRTNDIKSAKAYGCFSAAVTWGVADAWDLGLTTPDIILDSAAESRAWFIDGKLPGNW